MPKTTLALHAYALAGGALSDFVEPHAEPRSEVVSPLELLSNAAEQYAIKTACARVLHPDAALNKFFKSFMRTPSNSHHFAKISKASLKEAYKILTLRKLKDIDQLFTFHILGYVVDPLSTKDLVLQTLRNLKTVGHGSKNYRGKSAIVVCGLSEEHDSYVPGCCGMDVKLHRRHNNSYPMFTTGVVNHTNGLVENVRLNVEIAFLIQNPEYFTPEVRECIRYSCNENIAIQFMTRFLERFSVELLPIAVLVHAIRFDQSRLLPLIPFEIRDMYGLDELVTVGLAISVWRKEDEFFGGALPRPLREPNMLLRVFDILVDLDAEVKKGFVDEVVDSDFRYIMLSLGNGFLPTAAPFDLAVLTPEFLLDYLVADVRTMDFMDPEKFHPYFENRPVMLELLVKRLIMNCDYKEMYKADVMLYLSETRSAFFARAELLYAMARNPAIPKLEQMHCQSLEGVKELRDIWQQFLDWHASYSTMRAFKDMIQIALDENAELKRFVVESLLSLQCDFFSLQPDENDSVKQEAKRPRA